MKSQQSTPHQMSLSDAMRMTPAEHDQVLKRKQQIKSIRNALIAIGCVLIAWLAECIAIAYHSIK